MEPFVSYTVNDGGDFFLEDLRNEVDNCYQKDGSQSDLDTSFFVVGSESSESFDFGDESDVEDLTSISGDSESSDCQIDGARSMDSPRDTSNQPVLAELNEVFTDIKSLLNILDMQLEYRNQDDTIESLLASLMKSLNELNPGDEDEVVYAKPVMFFWFDRQDMKWVRKGRGVINILHNLAENKIRIFMKKNDSQICDHQLTSDMALKTIPRTVNMWTWTGVEFHYGRMRVEQFAARFATSEEAQSFHQKFAECQTLLRTDPEEDGQNVDASVIFSKKCKLEEMTDLDTWRSVGTGNVEMTFENCVTSTQISVKLDSKSTFDSILDTDVQLTVEGNACIWSISDYSSKIPAHRTFRAKFESMKEANKFQLLFGLAKEYAKNDKLAKE